MNKRSWVCLSLSVLLSVSFVFSALAQGGGSGDVDGFEDLGDAYYFESPQLYSAASDLADYYQLPTVSIFSSDVGYRGFGNGISNVSGKSYIDYVANAYPYQAGVGYYELIFDINSSGGFNEDVFYVSSSNRLYGGSFFNLTGTSSSSVAGIANISDTNKRISYVYSSGGSGRISSLPTFKLDSGTVPEGSTVTIDIYLKIFESEIIGGITGGGGNGGGSDSGGSGGSGGSGTAT